MSETAPHRHYAGPQQGPPPSFGASGAAGVPSAEQAESVAAWLRWHAIELVGVGVPLALALVSVWFVVLAVPAAGLWVINETRQRRAALTSPDTTNKEIER
jgi:hypothetical protein